MSLKVTKVNSKKSIFNCYASLKISASFFTMAYLAAGCGKPSNTNFPGNFAKVPKDTSDARFVRWSLLAKELMIEDGKEITEREGKGGLAESLAKPSQFFTSNNKNVADKYSQLLTAAQTDFVKNAHKTKCAKVVSLKKIGAGRKFNAATQNFEDVTESELYIMKYELYGNLKGELDPDTRTGLLSIPKDLTKMAKSAPVIAYAHGGDAGLSPYELAMSLGALQAKYIITAPTFPGEALCKTGTSFITNSCNEEGKYAEASPKEKSPFDKDTHELLGMHDCVVKAATASNETPFPFPVFDANDKPTDEDLSEKIAQLAKPIGGSGPYSNFPISHIMGASRGGMTVAVALAQAGTAISAFNVPEKRAALGEKYDFPPKFRCAIDFFAPKTFVATQFKVGLESFIRGYGENTVFINLPTARQLNDKWKSYGNGVSLVPGRVLTDEENAKLAAVEIVKNDVPMLSPLIFLALKNWREPTTTAGGLLSLHGYFDKTVSVNQTLFASTILHGINEKLRADDGAGNADRILGINYQAFGLTPPNSALAKDASGKEILLKGSQHGDPVFAASTVTDSLVNCKSFSSKDLEDSCYARHNASLAKLKGSTPSVTIQSWLDSNCN